MIDLRSDTVTKPTPAMRRAMAEAEVGDDVYGEDLTVNALETRVAELFGHEAALFVPSGSMGNQTAIQTLVPPGGELLCDADAHIVTYEIGAAAAVGGISTRTWSAAGGAVDQSPTPGLEDAIVGGRNSPSESTTTVLLPGSAAWGADAVVTGGAVSAPGDTHSSAVGSVGCG